MVKHEIRNVYDLEGTEEGKRIWIVAPGPTSQDLDDWGHLMEGDTVIALNSALEFIPKPTYWLYADKRFSWLYGHELHGNKRRMMPGLETPQQVICPHHQTRKMVNYFAGKAVYSFHYQMQITRRLPEEKRKGKPFWYAPDERFLPGHGSVVSTACSLACLLRPRVTILVGIDFMIRDGVYYHSAVKKNKGPTMRDRALKAGLNWFIGGLTKRGGIWPNLNAVTTSPSLASQTPIKHVGWKEIEAGEE